MRDRTSPCNRLRAPLARYGLRLRAAKIRSNKAPTQVRGTTFGNHAGNTNVHRLVKQTEFYNREIGLAEKEILREAANSRPAPQARPLVGMTGIDVYAAMPLAAETGGITRFSTPRKPVSMTGMRPAVYYQSGDSLRHGGTKNSTPAAS